ncbi:hypothetical protein [Roseomonas sp. HF4]|uniref:hypothetical protein n=1 Tax=Roseomonas sp. HF4 TaxID=2562313 RepID=UPI0010C0EE34|nr:hypothetical protein [Roseomonas sp. HF4]
MTELLDGLTWTVPVAMVVLAVAGEVVRRTGRPWLGRGMIWAALLASAAWTLLHLAEMMAIVGR